MDTKVIEGILKDIEKCTSDKEGVLFEKPTSSGRVYMQKIASQLESAFNMKDEDEKLWYYNCYNLLQNKYGNKLYAFLSQVLKEGEALKKDSEALGDIKSRV